MFFNATTSSVYTRIQSSNDMGQRLTVYCWIKLGQNYINMDRGMEKMQRMVNAKGEEIPFVTFQDHMIACQNFVFFLKMHFKKSSLSELVSGEHSSPRKQFLIYVCIKFLSYFYPYIIHC